MGLISFLQRRDRETRFTVSESAWHLPQEEGYLKDVEIRAESTLAHNYFE